MRRKKSIPIPVPEKQGLEYVCPSASWGGMTGHIPSGGSDDKADEVCKDICPCRPEYKGDSKST